MNAQELKDTGVNFCAECKHGSFEGNGPACSEGFVPDFVYDPSGNFEDLGEWVCDGCHFEQIEPKSKGKA